MHKNKTKMRLFTMYAIESNLPCGVTPLPLYVFNGPRVTGGGGGSTPTLSYRKKP